MQKIRTQRLVWTACLAFSLTLIVLQPAVSAAETSSELAAIKDAALKELEAPISKADWLAIKASADQAYNGEHYPEAQKLYKKAFESVGQRADFKDGDPPDTPAGNRQFEELLLNQFECNFQLAEYDQAEADYVSLLEGSQPIKQATEAHMALRAHNNLAQIYLVRGQFDKAQDNLKKAIELSNKFSGNEEDALMTTVVAAELDLQKQNNDLSEKEFRSAIDQAAKLGNAGRPLMGRAYGGLAQVEFYNLKLETAAANAESSLASAFACYGQTSMEAAAAMVITAKLQTRNDRQAAQQNLLRALSIQTTLLGKFGHPTIANTLLALAGAIDKPYSEGEAMCQTARHAVDGILDQNTPFYESYLDLLSRSYLSQGKYTLAIAAGQEEQAIQDRLYGPDSIQSADALRNVAVATEFDAFERGGSDRRVHLPTAAASELIEKAIKIADQKYGPGSARAARYQVAYSSIMQIAGEHAQSAIIAKKALATMSTIYPADDAALLAPQNILLTDYAKLGQAKEGQALIATMLKRQINAFGLRSPEVGRLFIRLQSLEKGTKQGDQTLSIIQHLPPEDTGTTGMIEQIKISLKALDSPTNGTARLTNLQKQLRAQEMIYGADSPNLVQYFLFSLADYYKEAGQEADAAAVYKRIVTIQENGLGKDHPALLRVLMEYSQLLKKLGQAKEADQMMARNVAISNLYEQYKLKKVENRPH